MNPTFRHLSLPSFEDIDVQGQLRKRAMRNFDRLESSRYHPEQVHRDGKISTWPGDTEGRIVLGLTLLARSTHRKARFLDDLVGRFPGWMNEEGFFGPVHGPELFDEQQFSSHGWALRGLCEYYEFTRKQAALDMIGTILHNLILPSAGHHAHYPIDPSLRTDTGGHIGVQTPRNGRWQLSSDIGCDFIALDGIVHAWALLRTDPVRNLVLEMIHRFLEIDLIAIHAQTHATLTALRAIIHFCQADGDPRWMNAVEKRYLLYRNEALTCNYANYNWFERPEWTEPCAMVDSFIVAFSLWTHTGHSEYLEDCHRIWYSALGHGQRSNGGYGPDTCAGATSPFIEVSVLEATWCCTMRGGEGLARAIQYLYAFDEQDIYVPFFNDSVTTLHSGDTFIRLGQRTEYPYRGLVHLDVEDVSEGSAPVLHLFRPSWALTPEIAINGTPAGFTELKPGFVTIGRPLAKGDRIRYSFGTRPERTGPRSAKHLQGYTTVFAGPVMLGVLTEEEIKLSPDAQFEEEAPGQYRLRGTDTLFQPVDDMIDRNVGSKGYRRQALFTQS